MAVTSVKVRAQSESAALSRVSNDRGQALDGVFSGRAKGFTPLELQAAALAACLDASLRIAARRAGLDGLGGLAVEVEAIKAGDAPSRLGQFRFSVQFDDALDARTRAELIAAAEDICTISNTLRAGARIAAAPDP